MKNTSWRRWPIYAWLIALYPILFLYSQNVGDVLVWQVWYSAVVSLIGVSLIAGLGLLITRKVYQAAALAATIALIFFSYGHVFNLLHASDRPRFQAVLVAGYALILIASVVVIWRSPSFIEHTTPALNVIGSVLLILTLPPILNNAYRAMLQSQVVAVRTGTELLADSTDHPDIYYILLDGYSSNAFLEHSFGYDNSAFTDALAERGFYIASHSHTPYAITLPAKFSTLNMRYISEDDIQAARQARTDIEYLQRGTADSAVSAELQSLGYSYIYMLSGFDVPSLSADQNVDFLPDGAVYFQAEARQSAMSYYQLAFYPLLLRTTVLRGVAQQVEENSLPADRPYDLREPERALAIWGEAERIAQRPEATFTVIHIIKPHEPVAFDAEGNIVQPYANMENSTREELSERFFEQLTFVNNRTLALIDTLIAQSDTPPIIIMQGDHGSVFGSPRSEDRQSTNFGILNVYYFPDRECEGLTQNIIPINSFRVMFNCYFDGDYPLLEPHYYTITDYDTMFQFEEIDIEAWSVEHEGSNEQ